MARLRRSHWTSRRRTPANACWRSARRGSATLDVLVNNAGQATWRAEIADASDADWQAAWELNVMAPLRLMRAAIPAMRERGWGRVVNVSSTAGKRPSARLPEYSVAKAAQLSLSRLHADAYAADGVLVNAVCPGMTASEMWMEPGGLLDQHRDLDRDRLALGGAGRRRIAAGRCRGWRSRRRSAP